MTGPIKLPKRRGPKPKDPEKLKEYLAFQEAAEQGVIVGRDRKKEAPEVILSQIQHQFDLLGRMTESAARGDIRLVLGSGSTGVGKTYTVTTTLEKLKGNKFSLATPPSYEILSGVVTSINLYKLLWRNRHKNHVAVLDDTDSVLRNEDSLNLLKAATDTGQKRYITWSSESSALTDEGVNKQFEFQGSVIALTNLSFLDFIEQAATNKLTPHMKALMSRGYYIDTFIHDKEDLVLWINHQLRTQKILQQAPHNLNDTQAEEVLQFVLEYPDDFYELSLRTPIKIAPLIRMQRPDEPHDFWKELARGSLMKRS